MKKFQIEIKDIETGIGEDDYEGVQFTLKIGDNEINYLYEYYSYDEDEKCYEIESSCESHLEVVQFEKIDAFLELSMQLDESVAQEIISDIHVLLEEALNDKSVVIDKNFSIKAEKIFAE